MACEHIMLTASVEMQCIRKQYRAFSGCACADPSRRRLPSLTWQNLGAFTDLCLTCRLALVNVAHIVPCYLQVLRRMHLQRWHSSQISVRKNRSRQDDQAGQDMPYRLCRIDCPPPA